MHVLSLNADIFILEERNVKNNNITLLFVFLYFISLFVKHESKYWLTDFFMEEVIYSTVATINDIIYL